MTRRNHNQLQSGWDLYLGNEGSWVIYMFKIQDPKGVGGLKKRYSSINNG